MKIEFMRIENWRSFYGVNEIIFSTDPEKNVTLVRAENGVGKTSLLAALNWCLFAILPPEEDFQNPKDLLNSSAIEIDNATRTKIELEFEHKGKKYKASRTYDQLHHRTNALRLVEIKDGGESPLSSSVNVDRFINSVLPKEMAPHFFFYGEATSRYADESGAQAFGSAVKNILGATVAGIALNDLERAFKDYQREASDNSSDEAIDVQKKIDEIEENEEPLKEQLEAAKVEEQAAEALVVEIDKQLLGSKQVREDQAKRDQLNKRLESLRTRLSSEFNESQKWFDKFGTALLAKSFIEDVKNLIEQEDTRKKIPGPFNEKFVNDVLEDGECICGRAISPGSPEELHVKSLLDTATDEMMINRILSTNVALGRLEEKGRNGWNVLQKSNADRIHINEQISIAEAEVKEISNRLLNSEISSIAEKEEARKVAKARQRSSITKQATIENTLKENQRRIEALRREQDKLVRESLTAKRYVKRAQLAGALSARLKSRLTDEEMFARIEIKKKIDAIISAFMRKTLTVKIDQNYRVSVKNENGDNAALSKGEKQLLGLAFTGAIADYARDREGEEVDILLSGTDAPLVVDAPFGELDDRYRKAVTNFLPEMAPQVVLLLSSSQGTEEVLAELEGKIGSQYILSRFEKAASNGREVETLDVNGRVFNLTQYDQEFTGTQIQEVN